MVVDFLTLFESALKNNLYKCKGFILRVYLILHGCKVGKKLRCHNFPILRIIPNNNISIGHQVTIGFKITLEVSPGGRLVIDDFVNLTQNILISAGNHIHIGAYSLIGENVSIRDGDHGSDSGKPICFQKIEYSPVYIGKDVWIGAGSFILKGSYVSDGAIIGANSVVLEKSQIKPDTIYAGSPVKEISVRK
jgi:acetyltransferase-like isoleucine patch superfamily enzyme